MVGRAAEIDQGEVELLRVLVDAGAAADDLLELGHGADVAVEHDEAAGLGIHAGGEQARGGDEDRVLGLRVDEVAELGAALGIVAGDAHDVAGVLLDEVGVLVDEGLAHAGGVFGVHAEDDGLLEAVAALLEELGDLLGDELGAVVDDEGAVEILLVVDAVLDLVAVAVELAFFGTVALDIQVDVDLDDLVGGEEAVLDALLERVGVDRLAEVMDVGDVLGFLGRGGEADLRGGGKVVEDLAPGGILGGAAAVAFVDDDEVEEAGRELAEELLPLLRAGDGLVEAEIDLVGGVDAALLVEGGGEFDLGAVGALDGLGAGAELGHGRAEGAEVVDHGLVDEDVAVGEKEDAFLPPGLPEPPDDLEGGVGLAGAGGHDEQDAVLPLGDGFDGGVDGVALVVARCLAAAVVEVVLEDDLLCCRASGPSRRSTWPRVRRAMGRRRGPGWFPSRRWCRCGRGRRSRRRWRRRRRGY